MLRLGFAGGDPVAGDLRTLPNPMRRANIAATLEPDADGDGFGDETQDACPTSAATNNDCAPPAATITNGPKDKTQKKRATFEFTGADARAVASFQCSLDGGTFAPCTSPRTVKVKKGKHTFQVQAVDQAGNVARRLPTPGSGRRSNDSLLDR